MIYMHANVINQLYHGSAHVHAIMHSLTLVHYRIALTFFTLWANSASDDKLILPPKNRFLFSGKNKIRKIFQNVVC